MHEMVAEMEEKRPTERPRLRRKKRNEIGHSIMFAITPAKFIKFKIVSSIAFSIMLCGASSAFADSGNGKKLFSERCAMCHGADAKGTGPLADKSDPSTPDLTTTAFKKRLLDYPGVIVSSVILRPNGNLIPKTLRENGVKLPSHAWTVKDFRDLNEYVTGVILKN